MSRNGTLVWVLTLPPIHFDLFFSKPYSWFYWKISKRSNCENKSGKIQNLWPRKINLIKAYIPVILKSFAIKVHFYFLCFLIVLFYFALLYIALFSPEPNVNSSVWICQSILRCLWVSKSLFFLNLLTRHEI